MKLGGGGVGDIPSWLVLRLRASCFPASFLHFRLVLFQRILLRGPKSQEIQYFRSFLSSGDLYSRADGKTRKSRYVILFQTGNQVVPRTLADSVYYKSFVLLPFVSGSILRAV